MTPHQQPSFDHAAKMMHWHRRFAATTSAAPPYRIDDDMMSNGIARRTDHECLGDYGIVILVVSAKVTGQPSTTEMVGRPEARINGGLILIGRHPCSVS